jgi:hypothetical protein
MSNLSFQNPNNKLQGQELKDALLQRQKLKDTFNKIIKELEEIKYRNEPRILKRVDGSLISEPEEGAEIIFINSSHQVGIDGLTYDSCFFKDLKKGLVFLAEDRHLAEKKAKMLSKQLEIQFEVDRLNAEEGGLGVREINALDVKGYICEKVTQNKMTEKTVKTILKKYTIEELKQYLGIII